MSEHQEQAARQFFAGVGNVGRVTDRYANDLTMPLFPLWLILDADGTLAPELASLVKSTHA